jgi:hypothetical protein
MSGCSLRDDDYVDERYQETAEPTGVGTLPLSHNQSQSTNRFMKCHVDGLTRDQKRGLGSWAATGPSTSRIGERLCIKCKTCPAKVISHNIWANFGLTRCYSLEKRPCNC